MQDKIAHGLPCRENAVDMAEISPTSRPPPHHPSSSRCKLRTRSPVAQSASVSNDSSSICRFVVDKNKIQS